MPAPDSVGPAVGASGASSEVQNLGPQTGVRASKHFYVRSRWKRGCLASSVPALPPPVSWGAVGRRSGGVPSRIPTSRRLKDTTKRHRVANTLKTWLKSDTGRVGGCLAELGTRE